MNEKEWKAGKNMDFSHADAVDSAALNQVLCRTAWARRHARATAQCFCQFADKSGRKAKEKTWIESDQN